MADSLVSNQQQVAELVDKLTLEDQPKDIDAVTGAADEELKVAVPDGAAAKDTKSQLDATEHRPFYPSNNYNGYYYLGPEGNGKEWEEQTRFPTPDNLDMQYPGVPSDNGSVVYYTSGFGYPQNPYNPYNPYIPGAPMMGGDTPYMGQRPPFFPGPYQQSPANGFFPPPMQPGRQENGSMPNGKANGNHVNKGMNKGFKDGLKGPQSGSQLPKNFRPMSQIQLNQQHGNGNGSAFSLKEHSQYRKFAPGFNQAKTMLPYANGNGMPFKPNIRPRGKFYGYHGNENWNFDGLNEQNRGPRINRPKGYQNGVDGKTNGDVPANKGEYNLENFAVNYETAKFFVIKSYSEDDVHQSIKYSVWASTPNGNKKLDGAYQEAQKASTDDKNECPIFLFFSVNASGQFCGVAQMTGNVDFNKSMDFWQQDKWNGFFPVKWHMIKDIPNSQFRQIILENNDNKPVTNSRDTQEIKYQQGIEMLKIFKSFAHKTSILDDFTFYEGRQKAMKEKKLKQKAVQQQLVAKGGAVPVGVDNGIKNSELISESINGCKGESILSPEKKEASPVQGLSLATNDSEPQVENPRVFIVGSVAC